MQDSIAASRRFTICRAPPSPAYHLPIPSLACAKPASFKFERDCLSRWYGRLRSALTEQGRGRDAQPRPCVLSLRSYLCPCFIMPALFVKTQIETQAVSCWKEI